MLKTIVLCLLVLSIEGTVSCKKVSESIQGGPQGDLPGTWVASEFIFDIGGGATWQKVSSENREVISFDNSGTGTIFDHGVKARYYYQVSSDSTMSVLGGTSASKLYYSLAGDTLTIAGPCIEACATRYSRADAD